MGFDIDISLLLGGMITLFLSLIAYFIKQLHIDFKRVERDLGEVNTTTQIIKTEFRSTYQAIEQRVEFLEKRVLYLEKFKS